MKEIHLNIRVKKQWYIIDFDHLIRHGCIHQTTNIKEKSKQETLKTALSKVKPLKSGGKTDVNGKNKVKSGSSKRKYSENEYSDV